MAEEALRFPFMSGGYRHVLLARVGRWCVVERTWVEDGREHLPHYELVQVRVRPVRTWPDGTMTPAQEGYPDRRNWGKAGWSDPTLRHVERRVARLREEGRVRDPPPTWTAVGLADDEEGYRAWKAGCLQALQASARTKAILGGHP